MEVNKRIMNPMRIEVLKNLQKKGETTEYGLASMSSYKIEAIRLAIQRLSELGLLKHTGGGFFEISPKGTEYLASLGEKV